jgi:hypothetical protein
MKKCSKSCKLPMDEPETSKVTKMPNIFLFHQPAVTSTNSEKVQPLITGIFLLFSPLRLYTTRHASSYKNGRTTNTTSSDKLNG